MVNIMANDFVYFLVGGLVIMGIMLALFGLDFAYGPPASSTLLGVGSPIFVGANDFDDVETLTASFAADNYLQTSVYNIGSRRISHGMLFGSGSIEVDVWHAGFLA